MTLLRETVATMITFGHLRIIFFAIVFLLSANFSCGLSGYNDDFKKPLTLNYDPSVDSYVPLTVESEEALRRFPRAVAPENATGTVLIKRSDLNDSRQQLIVHWAGEGSQVIICLARNPKDSPRVKPLHSTVYISYNYGETFENKTENFLLKPNGSYAHIEKFHIHPKSNFISAFIDSDNKKIFTTNDYGRTFTVSNITFTPSELSFDPDFLKAFFVHDKVDSLKRLYYTTNLGATFVKVQDNVKAFDWAVIGDDPSKKTLVIQRQELKTTHVISLRSGAPANIGRVLFSDATDFYVKGDYMFATKMRTTNQRDLYISYRGNTFIKANFSTSLELKDFHIADITKNRIFVAVGHHESLSHLYVSDVVDEESTSVDFTLSFERIFCYIRNITWTNSIINELAETDFIDLHKVEGLKGIYLASQVSANSSLSRMISPEHLTTMITYNWGADWLPLNVTHTLNGINCTMEENCSLHLSQRFTSWYPSTTKFNSVLSSKSIPGLIIATGTLGTSFKGHASVFVSKDGGFTWRQVLKENYYYNMGDHGGIIVAMKFYKIKDEGNEILYSTDEGETFKSYKLESTPLKIYSLMTEAGENTTVFSLFGSSPGAHKWVVVKADFRGVFPSNCTDMDFKIWKPGFKGDAKPCVMGQSESYLRRIPTVNCYNGRNSSGAIATESCPCKRDDFICDAGFIRDQVTKHCIRDKSYGLGNPYDAPMICPPYTFYNRTKGYRKIPRNMCVNGDSPLYLPEQIACPINESKEFLLLAQKDKILSFSPLVNPKPEILPIKDLLNVITVEFDRRRNCLYYADIVDDVISRVCFSAGTVIPEILVKNNLQSVEGMSLDWISNHLYFVDGAAKKIEVIRTNVNGSGHMRKTILDSKFLKRPRGIAVHPMAGYIFWTDWNMEDPYIGKAELNGSNPVKLFKRNYVEWPNGITVDFIANRIYWVDAKLDYICSSNLDGKQFKIVIQNSSKVSHPFSVAIYKDSMYWDDWKQGSIFFADKDHGTGVQFIANAMTGLMDLKVYGPSVQEGTNKCANNTECTHLCFGTPNNGFNCQCPDGLILSGKTKCVCPGGNAPSKNGTCLSVDNTCAADFFRCKNNVCIQNIWRCDGDNDCGDKSDEDCFNQTTCAPNKFQCPGSGRCIPNYWVCDHDVDCEDGADEKNCTYPTCKPDHFACDNGRCISKRWLCDTEDDCRDGSDEKNCSALTTPSALCHSDEFKCGNSQCIPMNWKCDGEFDCANNADEQNCTAECESWQFSCANNKCIMKTWICDGQDDCSDGFHSDEVNCTMSTTSVPGTTVSPLVHGGCQTWMFQCNNKRCIPLWWKCDNVSDCSDGSDEFGCFFSNDTTIKFPSTTQAPFVCQDYQFRCLSGDCILDSWVCDGIKDCSFGEDEKNCNETAPSCHGDGPFFKCHSTGLCIPEKKKCDGVYHCPDRSDEITCNTTLSPTVFPPKVCDPGFIRCDYFSCVPFSSICDKKPDCLDGTDEYNCDLNEKLAAIELNNQTDKTLFISWFVSNVMGHNKSYEFLPSIGLTRDPKSWKNETWIEDTSYEFTNLKPFESYNITVYVRDKITKLISRPTVWFQCKTSQGIPSRPQNVTVTKRNSMEIYVQWKPPEEPRGPIKEYIVNVAPPYPPVSEHFSAYRTHCTVASLFKPNKTYMVWVTAVNEAGVSPQSNMVMIKFEDSPETDVKNLLVESFTQNSVTLTWTGVKGKTYVIKTGTELSGQYPAVPIVRTVENSCTVNYLSPGVSYVFEVSVDNSSSIKPNIVSAKTIGPPLPVVENISAEIKESAILLRWSRPHSTGLRLHNLTYGIYFGVRLSELLNGSKYIVNRETTLISNVEACKSVLFTVGIVSSVGVGPLARPEVATIPINPKAAPSKPKVFTNGTKAVIQWFSSCNVVDNAIGYVVKINDTAISKITAITVPATKSYRINTTVILDYGGRYIVSVSTSANGSLSSPETHFNGPPLPIPHELQANIGSNSNCIVMWDESNVPEDVKKIGYRYVLSVYRGIDTNSSYKVYEVQYPPHFIQYLPENSTFTFAVQLMAKTGHVSERSELYTTSVTVGKTYEMSVKKEDKSYSYLAPVILIVLLVSAVLGVVYWRHVKNHPNFQNLANSHYNTRSGSATFSGVNGLDAEETPDIRECFSDDEPLVIA